MTLTEFYLNKQKIHLNTVLKATYDLFTFFIAQQNLFH